jgi:hypothetical protein
MIYNGNNRKDCGNILPATQFAGFQPQLPASASTSEIRPRSTPPEYETEQACLGVSASRRLDETPSLGGVEIFPATGCCIKAHFGWAWARSRIDASAETEWPIVFQQPYRPAFGDGRRDRAYVACLPDQ